MTARLRIQISDLSFGFGAATTYAQVFSQFTGEIPFEVGKATVLQGNNGVGKSVLARLIARVEPVQPSAGSIRLFDQGGSERWAPSVLYVPQHFETGYDRCAVDVFSSIASVGTRFLNPLRFQRALASARIGLRDRYRTCDAIHRVVFLRGILASAALTSIDLLILDEPFAQLSRSEYRDLDRDLTRFLQSVPFATMIVAHPEHVPSNTAKVFVLESVSGTAKEFREIDFTTRLRAPTGQPIGNHAMKLAVSKRGTKAVDEMALVHGVVNRLIAPPGLSPGRFAALITRSAKSGRLARWKGWRVDAQALAQNEAREPLVVRLLPEGAQTAIVLSRSEVVDSTLFDRWEAAPVRLLSRRLDRGRLKGRWFKEASDFLPIQHENPELLGRALSGGNRQLLALRIVSYPFPDMLVVASPFAGLDEVNVARVDQFLHFAAASGVIVVLTETGE